MELVSKYKTNDGKEFDSLKKAEEYLIDKTCRELDGIIKKNNVDINHRELLKLVIALCGDYGKLVNLQKYFNDLIGGDPYIINLDNDEN